ncbi:hypothetical protein ABFS82_04G209000 [Erythranthe guttata]
MAYHTGGSQAQVPYNPSARPGPGPDQPQLAYPYQTPPNPYLPHAPGGGGIGSTPPPQGYGYYPPPPPQQQQNVYNSFPPGTSPDVIRNFQMVDRYQKGYIEEKELQEALSSNYQKFSRPTLRLLVFLFRNSGESSYRIGPKEFADVWNCLGQWRAMFDRFDRDRSGNIDSAELRDALYSLGYALPPSVLQVLLSRYEDGTGRRVDLNFDSFVECGMIVKGLTEKFKEKDPRYTGSATLSYETFMSMVIPFIVSD